MTEIIEFETTNVMRGRPERRVCQKAHYDRWATHGAWFRECVNDYMSNAFVGVRYLYVQREGKGRSCIAIASLAPGLDALEINLGWLAQQDEDYYWSLFKYLADWYGREHWVSADVANDNIWIK